MAHILKRSRFILSYAIGFSIGVGIAAFLFIGVTRAQSQEPICAAFNTASYPETARIPVWVGYPEKWDGLPAGLLLDQEPIMLYTDDTITAGYSLFFDKDKQELWIFPHWSFESQHDLCGVVVYKLGEK